MAHNGKLKLSNYPNFSNLYEWEKVKIIKAMAKRLRRDQREKEERNPKKKPSAEERKQALDELARLGQEFDND